MHNGRWLAGMMAGALVLCLLPGRAESQIGLSPEDVLQVEQRLHGLGFLASEENQVYDAETRQALESFQQANGLPVTGQVDKATADMLGSGSATSRQDYLRRFVQEYQDMEPMRLGDINNQVQAVQRKLQEYGYFTGNPDGVFSNNTQQAVERFQMVNGLTVTGEADGMTLMRLLADVPITWQGFLSEMSCTTGDGGLNVYVLQKKLSDMGYFEGDCTASFGDVTQAAVTAFQSENGLETTGVADASVWELIYSGTAVARRRPDMVQRGDTGDNVKRIQSRLNALGYYAPEADGVFDFSTETAIYLFQMGNDISATGRVGGDTLSALFSDTARPLGDATVQQRYAALLSNRDSGVQARIYEIASHLVGVEFKVRDDALYPGFGLVQYACVAAGLPITTPETVIRLADDAVEDPEETGPGNIIAFQTAGTDSVTMLMTIGAGDGRIIYATPEIGWVVMSYMNQIDSENVYRWAEPAP